MGCHGSTLSSRVAFPTRASPLLCSRSVFMFYRHEQLPPLAWSLTRELCYTLPLFLLLSPLLALGYVAVAFLLGRDQSMGMFERN